MDGQTDMVGDVLSGHGQVNDFRSTHAFGEVQQKGGDALRRPLAGKDQGVVLTPPKGPDGDLPKCPRQTHVSHCAAGKLGPFHRQGIDAAQGFGCGRMLHAGLKAEKIPRQMKPCDLPAAITQQTVADDGTAEHPIDEPDRLTLPEQNRTGGEGRSGCCCRVRKCTA